MIKLSIIDTQGQICHLSQYKHKIYELKLFSRVGPNTNIWVVH